MRKLAQKKVSWFVAVGAVVALVASAAALAWYMGQGSGSGDVAQGGSAPLALSVTIPASQIAAIYPGDSDPYSFSVDNAGAHDANINGVQVTGVSASGGSGTCDSAWFSATASAPAGVIAKSGGSAAGTGTLSFNNVNADQSGCSGATITVSLATD